MSALCWKCDTPAVKHRGVIRHLDHEAAKAAGVETCIDCGAEWHPRHGESHATPTDCIRHLHAMVEAAGDKVQELARLHEGGAA